MQVETLNRHVVVEDMNHALRATKLLGKNDDGHICVWSGGYGFNVYDAAKDWSEIGYFSSGDLAAVTDYESDEAVEMARKRMEMDGFEPIN